MNLDPLSFALTQISYLVTTLTKKNYNHNTRELNQLVKRFGLEASRHLLRCLFSSVDFSEQSGAGGKGSAQAQLLSAECGSLLNNPALVSTLCHAIDNPLLSKKFFKPTPELLRQISRTLSLSTLQEVVISLSLLHSADPDTVNNAAVHLKLRFPDLIKPYIDTDSHRGQEEGGLHDTSPEVLQLILTSLSNGQNIQLGVPDITHNLFLSHLCRDFPRDRVPLILAPFLYPEDTEPSLINMSSVESSLLASAMMDSAWSELILEIGYAFTSSVEECRNTLMSGRDLNPADVAKIISMMARTHSSLSEGVGLQTPGSFWPSSSDNSKDKAISSTTGDHPTTWKLEIFIQALKEIVPSLNWKEVCMQLDHPEFIIKDRQALSSLFTLLRLGLQSAGCHQNVFPVECIYRHWNNVEGQLSLITNILKNPDIFCFADHPYAQVQVDLLKSPPESDNKDIASWRSLHLIEVLLFIAESGFYPQAHELFKTPIQHCPDVLVLALLQINPPVTVFRQELLTNLMPIFLGNHPNGGTILHNAWHSQNVAIKPVIMHAMAEWYLRGEHDQSRLSRILDVAQDLKALSMLLNARSFMFVIDLACLASRREYLKLEKWLTDKIREHGETFVSAIVKFLQRRCPQIMGNKVAEDQIPKAAQLPHETIATMLACLQVCVGNVQQELSEAIMTMATNCSLMLSNSRQAPPPGVLRPHRNLETPFNPSSLGGQLFNAPNVDSIANLSTNLANMNLGAPGNTAFNLPASLGPLVSSSGSPPRLLGAGPSNSPFPMMPLQHTGAVGAGPSVVQGVSTISGLGRMGPTPGLDKPRLLQDAPILFPDMAQNVTKEVEDEANSYFQRIYNHPPHPTLSIDAVLDMLKKFQDSELKHEREVFHCMLRNLFEEYRFFPQYPDKELHITAQLFGGIIERGLVSSYMALGMALRFVLDALRKPEGSKMYYFGIAALDRFKTRLKDYHKYCEHVRTIPHFNEFPQHLIEYVEYGLQSAEPPNKPQGPVLPASLAAILSTNPSTTNYRTTIVTTPISTSTVTKPAPVNTPSSSSISSSRPSIAVATNIDTLLVATEREEKMTAPPESVQDKTAFIFNNLSQLNLQTKCEEIREIITEEYWPWISQYLVMKRASIELNFHALYSNFLDCLKIPEVNQIVTKETFRNIKVLLRSDKGIANFSDRSLLKNLGHWLGMLTLGRNKPILQIDIDIKSLLVEAYVKGQQELLYVVPFVAKVLESCAKSRVFKPPNPWTMGIMNVLAELHQEQDLKLNLKFEIEVLCKNLSIDVSELKPAIYLKDPERVRNLEYQLSHPNKNKEVVNSTSVPPSSSGNASADEMATVSSVTPTNTGANSDSSTGGSANTGPPEPRFSYWDITINSTACLAQHITVSPMIQLFQSHPHLKLYIRGSIERAIQEWILPVVDRSIKIALTTSEQVVRKDFALDPDEIRMRTSAHHMVRNLSAGMAMITCRDQLLSSINTNLKTAFLNAMAGATPQQKELAESAATQLASDNMELACAYVQKTAVEKALSEIDKRLINDFELRKIARNDGRRYCDPMALTYQAERMPEQIRLKVGGISSSQLAVYEEFARNIPGFLPLNDRDAASLFLPKPAQQQQDPLPVTPFPQSATSVVPSNQPAPMSYGLDEMSAIYDKLYMDIEKFLGSPLTLTLSLQATLTHGLLECLILARRSRDVASACNLLQRAVEGLLEGLSPMPESPEPMIRFRELHMRVLKMLQDPRAYGVQWTNKQVTRCLQECREEVRYNLDAIDCLIRSNLVNLPQYDLILAQCMDNGNNYMAVAFAMSLVQLYLIDERLSTQVSEYDLFNTIDMLARMAVHSRQPPEGLATLLDMLRASHDTNSFLGDRAPGGPTAQIHSGILQVRAADDDPPGLLDKTDLLLRDWVQIYHTAQASRDPTKAFSVFVHQMNVNGILKTDDLITRFFRLSTQICVDVVYRNLNDQSLTPTLLRAKCFSWLDAFVRLVSLLVKHSGDSGNTSTKINLLNKVLGIVAGCLLQDHESHGTGFQQLPYHRIFIMLFLELNSPEPVLESINYQAQVLTAFCHTLHILRPTKAPGFCYAWLELISHRIFIGRMLAITPQQKAWGMYAQLLIDLFRYLAPFLRNAELAKPVTLLYRGTLRVLLVLLHDFPEFLCDYHYGFCDVIPPNCIQMRNLILSAFPRNMRLPDPFTPNLKVDMLSEISHAPRVMTNYATIIQPVTFKKDLDSYLKARAPVTFLSELRSNMQISNEPGLRYNIPLMNAVVLYVGTQAIAHIRTKGQTPNMSTIVHSAHMDIFQNLAVDLDNEGRYLFLNAIANQLRYPNSHTHYFSCALLYLFVEANTEAIQEQITRVLLERLIVNRPHPWGLLITFIELIKNPTYKFWDHDFVHCAPEIEKLFESVARSCMVVKTPQPAISDNELPE